MSACCSALRVEQCLERQAWAHRLRLQLETDQARQAKGAVLVEATSHQQGDEDRTGRKRYLS